MLLNHGNPPNGRNRSIAFGRAIWGRSRTTAVGKRILQIRIAILLRVCDSALWRLAMLLTLGQLYPTKTFVDVKTQGNAFQRRNDGLALRGIASSSPRPGPFGCSPGNYLQERCYHAFRVSRWAFRGSWDARRVVTLNCSHETGSATPYRPMIVVGPLHLDETLWGGRGYILRALPCRVVPFTPP